MVFLGLCMAVAVIGKEAEGNTENGDQADAAGISQSGA